MAIGDTIRSILILGTPKKFYMVIDHICDPSQAYIKKNKLNKGRTIHPDAKLKKVFPANSLSMFKMPGMLSKSDFFFRK